MESTSQEQTPQATENTDVLPSEPPGAAPNVQVLRHAPVIAPSPDDVASMIVEETRFADAPEQRAAALRLLEAGYTVREAARRLDLRSTTVWRWAQAPELQTVLEAGRNRRRQVLAQRMESAADVAIDALVDVLQDPATPARDRINAAEAVLDRCGISPETPVNGNPAGLTVDIDFDERLARIVAGNPTGRTETATIQPDRPDPLPIGGPNPPGLTFHSEE